MFFLAHLYYSVLSLLLWHGKVGTPKTEQSLEKFFDIAHGDICWDECAACWQFQELLKIDGNIVLVHYYPSSPYQSAWNWTQCSSGSSMFFLTWSWQPNGSCVSWRWLCRFLLLFLATSWGKNFSFLLRTAALNTGKHCCAIQEQNIMPFQTWNPFFHSEKTGCWCCLVAACSLSPRHSLLWGCCMVSVNNHLPGRSKWRSGLGHMLWDLCTRWWSVCNYFPGNF